MKRFNQILGISILFLGLAACESMPEESSSGSPLWQRIRSASAAPGRHHKMRLHAGQGLHHPGAPDVGLPTEDQLATRGNGMRHRRFDGRRHDGRRHDGRRGDMNRPGRGAGRHGLRDGGGRGPRDGNGRRRDGVAPGEGRRPRGTGRHLGPPAEALAACENKAAGDACSFMIEGETVTSTCSKRRSGEGPLACRTGRRTHHRRITPAQ